MHHTSEHAILIARLKFLTRILLNLLPHPLGFGDKLWYDKMQERDLGERVWDSSFRCLFGESILLKTSKSKNLGPLLSLLSYRRTCSG